MRKRLRPTNSFMPQTNELEKLAGASALVFGEPVAIFFAFVNQPIAGDLAARPGVAHEGIRQIRGQSAGHRPSSAIDTLTSSEIAAVSSSGTARTSQASAPELASPPPTLANLVGSGLIRPLSLTPDVQPEMPTDIPLPQPSNPALIGGATVAGFPIALSGTTAGTSNSGVVTTPASSGVDGPAQTPTVVTALGGGNPGEPSPSPSSSNRAQSTPVHARVQAATGRTTAVKSVVSGTRHDTNPHHGHTAERTNASTRDVRTSGSRTGGIPLGNGYIATGGSHRTEATTRRGSNPSGNRANSMAAGSKSELVAFDDPGSDGGTGTGTGTGTITGLGTGSGTGSFSGTGTGTGMSWSTTSAINPTSATGTSSSAIGGTYTITDTGTTSGTPNGGGGGFFSVPVTGRLIITPMPGGRNDVIGGKAQYTLSGGGNTVISDEQWFSEGVPVMYSGQTIGIVNNQYTFINSPYNISSNNNQQTTSAFYWGEKPDQETLSVTANVQVRVNGKLSKPVEESAELKINVADPRWNNNIVDAKYAVTEFDKEFNKYVLAYYSNVKRTGINWGSVTPKLSGSFRVVQIIQSGASVKWTYKNGAVLSDFWNKNATTNPPTWTPAPFPLLDIRSGTDPWYPFTVDNPRATVATNSTTSINVSYVDYLMFQPTGSIIWVPEATFKWSVNATATPNGALPPDAWTVTKGSPLGLTQDLTVNHTDWPKWADVRYKYKDIK
jgi:hypothetical protein